MAKSTVVTVNSSTATILATAALSTPTNVLLSVTTASSQPGIALLVGGADLSQANGFPLGDFETPIALMSLESLYGMAAGSGAPNLQVNVLTFGMM